MMMKRGFNSSPLYHPNASNDHSTLPAESAAVIMDNADTPVPAFSDSSVPNSSPRSENTILPPPLAPSPGPVPFLRKSSPFYVLCTAICVAAVALLGFVDISRVSSYYREELKGNLADPWLIFRIIGSQGLDVTDPQWYYLVRALPAAVPAAIVFLVAKLRLRRCFVQPSSSLSFAVPSASKARAVHLFHIGFGLFFALGVTGPRFFFSFSLLLFNYFVISKLNRRFSFRTCMTIMWVWHIGMLFVNYYFSGYSFSLFGLPGLDELWPTLVPWTSQYNISVLRMIAFNNDMWEAADTTMARERRKKVAVKHEQSCIDCAIIRHSTAAKQLLQRLETTPSAITQEVESVRCYKCRTEYCRDPEEYTLAAYLGYLLYPPLFMAGPISSFNAYVSYVQSPSLGQTRQSLLRYAARAFGNAFALALYMHFNYIPAILFSGPPAPRTPDGPQPLSVLQLIDFSTRARLLILTLGFLWLKLNVIWKLFRCFALVDGVDVPENMPRCFCNTVNIQGFWRDWHASFNLWIVRYMYIPMGGSSKKMLSIFPIFFFVAVWHDIEMRLLFWAFFICAGLIPEVIITSFFASKRNAVVLRIKKKEMLWRSLRILGCQIGMMELVIINLIGFSVGTSGITATLMQLRREITWTFSVTTAILFFSAAVIAIQDRDQKAHEAQVLRVTYNLLAR